MNINQIRINQLAIVTTLLLVFGFIMIQVGKQRQIAQQHQAYTICLEAHSELDGASEAACGSAQDATHTEFLCDKTGAYCWLEVK